MNKELNVNNDMAGEPSFWDELVGTMNGVTHGNTADKYRAAGMILQRCGDKEMSDLLSLLSAQADFDDNIEGRSAIERTTRQLDRAIAERKKRHYLSYIKKVTDEEILSFSNGEVTKRSVNDFGTCFLEGGIFDPAIFGGSGEMPVLKSPDAKIPPHDWGLGMGHINLPCRVMDDDSLHTARDIIGIKASDEDLKAVVHYSKYIVVDSDDPNYPAGIFVDYQDAGNMKANHPDVKIGIGADALYEMMHAKGYPDNPERIAYRVIPVVSPVIRKVFFCEWAGNTTSSPLSDRYDRIITDCERVRKCKEAGVPEIVLHDRLRYLIRGVLSLYDDLDDSGRYSLLKIAADRRINAVARGQALMAGRLHCMSYEKQDVRVSAPIKDCGYYPETVYVRRDDGTLEKMPFLEIASRNDDTVWKWSCDHSLILPSDNMEEYDEETKKEIESYDTAYEKLLALVENTKEAAHEKRESLVLAKDKESGLLIPV